MLTQRQIRKSTRGKFSTVARDVAKQNPLSAKDVEIAYFALQSMDMSRFRGGQR